MRFEWDERKNQGNIRQHRLDFVDAQQVFRGPVLRILDERRDYGENRRVGIGMLDDIRIVVVVYTELDETTIRIISMRKALAHERKRYDQAFKDGFGSL